MPDDAERCNKYAGGHTSALGELFIADVRAGVQEEVYKSGSGGRVGGIPISAN
jgi:hypothetical protein